MSRGYQVELHKLDAQWLGVPQERERLIFIGVRDDLRVRPRAPKHNDWHYTIKDALPHVRDIEGWHYKLFIRSADRPLMTVMASSQQRLGGHYVDGSAIERLPIDELKPLCGFPADFKFPEASTYEEMKERLGNAVPPPMAYAIAREVRDVLLKGRR